jgi:hypothetical protein
MLNTNDPNKIDPNISDPKDISKLSQKILGYYNKKYNNNEKNSKQKIPKEGRKINDIKQKYKSVIIKDADIQRKKDILVEIKKKKEEELKKIEEELKKSKSLVTTSSNKKPTNIFEAIKVNNKEQFTKIIYYRFLVIQKKIKIMNLVLSMYIDNRIILCIDEEQTDPVIKAENNKIITELKDDIIILENVINNALLKDNDINCELDKSILELQKILQFYNVNNKNDENNK